MAAPVISGTDPASPITFNPGETKAVRVLASDPDIGATPVTQVFNVADTGGNTSSISVTLQLTDDLTYSADPAPTGWAVVQSATDEAVFNVTAPS